MCNIHVMRTWDAFMAQDPASKREAACAAVSWNYQPNCQHNRDSERSNPEQGSICSQVISRKGSILPSGEEYLRAGRRAV